MQNEDSESASKVLLLYKKLLGVLDVAQDGGERTNNDLSELAILIQKVRVLCCDLEGLLHVEDQEALDCELDVDGKLRVLEREVTYVVGRIHSLLQMTRQLGL